MNEHMRIDEKKMQQKCQISQPSALTSKITSEIAKYINLWVVGEGESKEILKINTIIHKFTYNNKEI